MSREKVHTKPFSWEASHGTEIELWNKVQAMLESK